MVRWRLADNDDFTARSKPYMDTLGRRAAAHPAGACPLILQMDLLQFSSMQTCDKCVPCRDGLPQLQLLVKQVLDGEGTMETLERIRSLATLIEDSADCAIGYEAARQALSGLDAFWDEYLAHVQTGKCSEGVGQKIPCESLCPAHVDIPGYIALIAERDYAGAVRLIRQDNPFPVACAMVCEHPCEERCRRQIIDDRVNIRGLKKFAVDNAGDAGARVPSPNVATGKSVGVIGGGPSGLTAAYYLGLMGHSVTIYERHDKLGGMLRYGIPNYRLPKDRLDDDIDAILQAGDIKVEYGRMVGSAEEIAGVVSSHDAVYMAIGAQLGKTLRIDGTDAAGVSSAVDMLDRIGAGEMPDFSGKRVIVVGGGNVAMDAARTAVRCHAKKVRVVYRRRQDDMTALDSEIQSAIMEGVELITLQAPKAIDADADGRCIGLVVQPQVIGPFDRAGRPAPRDADKPPITIPGEVVLIAVGQDIASEPFEEYGVPTDRRVFKTLDDASVQGMRGVYAGGDCATGPATAIRAIAAGKVAARNIDEYLGYHHALLSDVEVPGPHANNRTRTGRVDIVERLADIRKGDFEHVENEMSLEEAMQEASRCLRCDCYGCGSLLEGRTL